MVGPEAEQVSFVVVVRIAWPAGVVRPLATGRMASTVVAAHMALSVEAAHMTSTAEAAHMV